MTLEALGQVDAPQDVRLYIPRLYIYSQSKVIRTKTPETPQMLPYYEPLNTSSFMRPLVTAFYQHDRKMLRDVVLIIYLPTRTEDTLLSLQCTVLVSTLRST